MSPPHSTFGALLIGYMVSTPVYGITFLQAIHYFRHYSNDSLLLKTSVGIVWFLETFDQIVTSYTLYYYLIIHESDVGSLRHIVWSLVVPALTNGLAGTIIQTFFAWRIYVLSQNMIVVLVIETLSLGQLGLTLALTIQTLRFPNEDIPHSLMTATFAVVAAVDALITISLCFYLQIRRSGHSRTDTIVEKVIILTINNGLLTCAIALAAFVVKLVLPFSLISFALCMTLGKVYTNTLLSSLNSRGSARRLLENPDFSSNFSARSYRNTMSRNTTSHESHVPIPARGQEKMNIPISSYNSDVLYITRGSESITS